jgi:hypothetical protein
MSSKTGTLLDEFKRTAAEIKKATGMKHADVLEQLARKRGYANYHEAQTVLSRSPAINCKTIGQT